MCYYHNNLKYKKTDIRNYEEIKTGNSSAKVYQYKNRVLKYYFYSNEREKQKYLNEISVMSKLIPYNIVPEIFDVYYSDFHNKKCICVIMKKFIGCTLSKINDISENEKMMICFRILYNCLLIYKVCGRHIEHGDLHPDNIIIDKTKSIFKFNKRNFYTYNVYIIDFESCYKKRIRYKTCEFIIKNQCNLNDFIVFLFVNLLNVRSDLKNWLVITLSWIECYKKMISQISQNIFDLKYYDYIKNMKISVELNNSININKYVGIFIPNFNVRCLKIVKPALQLYEFAKNIDINICGIYVGSINIKQVDIFLQDKKIHIYTDNTFKIRCIIKMLNTYDKTLSYEYENDNTIKLKKDVKNQEGTVIKEFINKINSISLV